MTKRLLAAALVVLGALWLLPGVAGAAGETIGGCIVEKMEDEGGAVATQELIEAGEADDATEEQKKALEDFESSTEDCVDAPNPILPEMTEIIWGTAAFALLVGLMSWKLFPLVRKAMNDRQAKIQDDLDTAERSRLEADELVQQHESELAGAKTEAAGILETARTEVEEYRNRRRSEIEEELVELRARGVADVEASKAQALSDLQNEVSNLALGAAESVIGRELEDRQTQVQLVEDYISSVRQGEGTS